jgi:hypothetical protein
MNRNQSFKIVINIFLVCNLFSCNQKSFDYPPTTEILYYHDFKNGNGGWQSPLKNVHLNEINGVDTVGLITYKKGDSISVNIRVKIENDYSIINSPFFYDTNHSKPMGAGTLYLLNWLYLNGYQGTKSTEAIKELDLRNSKIKVSLNIHDLGLKMGSNLHFWFQTTLGNQLWANYVLISQPINKIAKDTSNIFQEVTLNLPDREDQGWLCLGTSIRDSYRYKCDENFQNSISRVNYDFGFVIFPVDTNYANDRTRNLKIKSIVIYK